jgi:protein gp37
MSEQTKISWTRSTFNPWLGCTKVSPACAHCYAESWAKRSGLVKWGQGEPRRRTSGAKWREPYGWNQKAKYSGEFWPVFCGSLCDVAENNPQLIPWRADLCRLVESCRSLTWQFLTKRPWNYYALFPEGWFQANPHVWAGTTVESPVYLPRIDALKTSGASTLFLSIEPLLEPLPTLGEHLDGIDWVIVGGESGPGARPMNPEWALNIRYQCEQTGTKFFMKQMGGVRNSLHQIEQLPENLRIREVPEWRKPER